MELATVKRRKVSTAPDLESARERIAEAVNLPRAATIRSTRASPTTLTLARAVVELAAVLEASR